MRYLNSRRSQAFLLSALAMVGHFSVQSAHIVAEGRQPVAGGGSPIGAGRGRSARPIG
ncbi:MAG: hypothetical protein WBB69_16350 [Anaerolineales bacterium]